MKDLLLRNTMCFALIAILSGCAGSTDVNTSLTLEPATSPSSSVSEPNQQIMPDPLPVPVISHIFHSLIAEGGPEFLSPDSPSYTYTDKSAKGTKMRFGLACIGNGKLVITRDEVEIGAIACNSENQTLDINIISRSINDAGISISVTAASGSATFVWILSEY